MDFVQKQVSPGGLGPEVGLEDLCPPDSHCSWGPCSKGWGVEGQVTYPFPKQAAGQAGRHGHQGSQGPACPLVLAQMTVSYLLWLQDLLRPPNSQTHSKGQVEPQATLQGPGHTSSRVGDSPSARWGDPRAQASLAKSPRTGEPTLSRSGQPWWQDSSPGQAQSKTPAPPSFSVMRVVCHFGSPSFFPGLPRSVGVKAVAGPASVPACSCTCLLWSRLRFLTPWVLP